MSNTTIIKPLKIGNFLCPNNLVLAPLAGITDSPFRRLCIKGGAGLVVGEMVSAQAVRYGNKKTERMMVLNPDEHPCAIQIFGGDPFALSVAAEKAQAQGADIVDINAGCPVKKIMKSGGGAVLMKDEAVFARAVRATVAAVSIPVTVKIRCGWKKGEVISPRFAKIAQEEGAAAVTVHGRPVEVVHSGSVDMQAIADTAAAVSIPVIGNGGVCDGAGARAMLAAGCAGVMIGRAAVGNPLVFSEIRAELSGGKIAPVGIKTKLEMFLDLLEMNCGVYGEGNGIVRARKVVGYWIEGFPNCSAVRGEFVRLNGLAQARELIERTLKSIC